MVKKLDEKDELDPIDHIGWRLWRAARAWKEEFDAEMVAAGHGWMTEARGAVIGHLRSGGMSQSALTVAMGISKQAVQQLIDELSAEGVVERTPDPADGRGRIVKFTRKGVAAVSAANDAKRAIEARYRRKVGSADLAILQKALDRLAE